MSRSQLAVAFHVAVLLLGATVSLVILWWLDDWIAAALAAMATVCLTLPVYARHDYLREQTLLRQTQERLTAHTIATQARIESLRDRDRKWLEAERQRDGAVVDQLLASNNALQQHLARYTDRPREKGRWVKSKTVDADTSKPRLNHAKPSRRAKANIKNAARDVGTAIRDLEADPKPILQIGYDDPGPERQVPGSGGEAERVEGPPVGHEPPLMPKTVPAGGADAPDGGTVSHVPGVGWRD